MLHAQGAVTQRNRIRNQAERHRLLGDPTRLTIVEALSGGPRLVAELSRLTGVHRNTVRAHLARLEAAGMLEAEPIAPSGKGRPAVQYRLRTTFAPAGTEQRLLIEALLRLVAGAHEAGAGRLAEEEGRRIGNQLGRSVSYPTAEQAVSQVTAVLRELAFEPRLTRRGRVSEISLRNCPFGITTGDPRGVIVCSFHLGLIRGVLESAGPPGPLNVQLLPHVVPGDCRAEVQFG